MPCSCFEKAVAADPLNYNAYQVAFQSIETIDFYFQQKKLHQVKWRFFFSLYEGDGESLHRGEQAQ